MSLRDTLGPHLRDAWRGLRKNPTYTLVIVATLGLGIAANTVIFSVMTPYLLRPLPYADADRLVQVGQVEPRTGWEGGRFSLAMLRDYREGSSAIEDFAAYRYGDVTLADEERPMRVTRSEVTANLFSVLGVDAARGRTFLPDEEGPGADVVILAHGLWQTRYGGDPEIVGRRIELDGVAHTVVGIMPQEFVFPWNEVTLWTPLTTDPGAEPRERTAHILVGRLADGWTRETARTELQGIQERLAAVHPDADGEFAGISVRPLRESLNFAWDAVSVGFPLLLAAVGLMLLIVCVNVASLMFARNAARRGELAVRVAMGARRRQVVGLLLTESALLAGAGGTLGVTLAYWMIAALAPAIPDVLYRVGDVTLDGTALAYTAALTLATPFLFGLGPALRAGRADPVEAIRPGSAGSTGRGARQRGRRMLVAAEVALAVVLVTGAGLMLRSFAAVQATDLGFAPERLLTVEVELPERGYAGAEEVETFFERAASELSSLPGVDHVGAVLLLPMNHEMAMRDIAAAGSEPPSQLGWPLAIYNRASPEYFEALGAPLRAGRPFREGDGEDVAIVSESLARRHLGAEAPVGATILVDTRGQTEELTVVGVVGDVQHADLIYENRPQLYRPLSASEARRRFLVVRTGGRPQALVGGVRDRLASVDPGLPVVIRPMSEILRENTFVWSVGSLVLGAFGLFAVFLASLGIYGVIAYSVERRRREMGVRLALGATADRVRRLVVGEGLRLVAIGSAVGLGLAVVAGRFMEAILYQVGGLDPLALGGTLAIFILVALGASWIPAGRASRTEVMTALRE